MTLILGSTEGYQIPGQDTVEIMLESYSAVSRYSTLIPVVDVLFQILVESFCSEPAAESFSCSDTYTRNFAHSWANLKFVGWEGLTASHDQHVG